MKKEYDVLIIEDEPVVIESTKKILSSAPLAVDAAEDAETALQKLQQNRYGVILSDLMLPNVDGFELLKRIKGKYDDVPVIMITGYATYENALRSFKAGVFDFVPKPFEIEEIRGVVHRAMKFKESIHDGKRGFVEIPHERDDSATRYFLGDHSWVKVDLDGSAEFGVGKTFAKLMGTIEAIEFPAINEEVMQGNMCARIICADDLVHVVWAPLSGRIIEKNQALEQNIDLLNTDPFSKGWLVRTIPTNLENELENLSKSV